MARPISDEELQLKRRARRRLIGAIVLVTAIVVVLPMVLDSEPKPITGEVSIKIPAPDSSTFTSRVVPVGPGSESKSQPAARLSTEMKSPPKAEEAAGKQVANSASGPAPAEQKSAAPAAPPATPPVKPAQSVAAPAPKAAVPPAAEQAGSAQREPESFAVQIVALADAGKAKEVQAQVAAAGIKSYTEVVKTKKGDVTRVRAGPFTTRSAAEKARDQLKAIGLNGNVVPQ